RCRKETIGRNVSDPAHQLRQGWAGAADVTVPIAYRAPIGPHQLAALFLSDQASDVAFYEGFRMTAHREHQGRRPKASNEGNRDGGACALLPAGPCRFSPTRETEGPSRSARKFLGPSRIARDFLNSVICSTNEQQDKHTVMAARYAVAAIFALRSGWLQHL